MTTGQVLRYLGIWSVFGSVVFSIWVWILFRTGLVWSARTKEGHLKKQIPLSGVAAMGSVLFLMVGLQLLANYYGLKTQGIGPDFAHLFLLNYALYYILFLYDTLVIDILVLVIWHPRFLRLPDTEAFTSARYHLRTIPAGTILGVLMTSISTLISFYGFLKV